MSPITTKYYLREPFLLTREEDSRRQSLCSKLNRVVKNLFKVFAFGAICSEGRAASMSTCSPCQPMVLGQMGYEGALCPANPPLSREDYSALFSTLQVGYEAVPVQRSGYQEQDSLPLIRAFNKAGAELLETALVNCHFKEPPVLEAKLSSLISQLEADFKKGAAPAGPDEIASEERADYLIGRFLQHVHFKLYLHHFKGESELKTYYSDQAWYFSVRAVYRMHARALFGENLLEFSYNGVKPSFQKKQVLNKEVLSHYPVCVQNELAVRSVLVGMCGGMSDVLISEYWRGVMAGQTSLEAIRTISRSFKDEATLEADLVQRSMGAYERCMMSKHSSSPIHLSVPLQMFYTSAGLMQDFEASLKSGAINWNLVADGSYRLIIEWKKGDPKHAIALIKAEGAYLLFDPNFGTMHETGSYPSALPKLLDFYTKQKGHPALLKQMIRLVSLETNSDPQFKSAYFSFLSTLTNLSNELKEKQMVHWFVLQALYLSAAMNDRSIDDFYIDSLPFGMDYYLKSAADNSFRDEKLQKAMQLQDPEILQRVVSEKEQRIKELFREIRMTAPDSLLKIGLIEERLMGYFKGRLANDAREAGFSASLHGNWANEANAHFDASGSAPYKI